MGSPPNALIAGLAAIQHGVVARWQLLDIGITPDEIAYRIRAGLLHRMHRGVYAVGHTAVTREGRWLAAVLACGPAAALSHRSAAALWTIRPTARANVDVTRSTSGHQLAGIDVHRASLRPRDVETRSGIRVTSVARTLLDLCDVLPRPAIERALGEAEYLRLLDASAVTETLTRANGRRGAGLLRALAADAPQPRSRSELERRFHALCVAAGLPSPRTNIRLDAGTRVVEADFLWSAQRLNAEVDGRGVHARRAAFERDRQRDADLMVAGYRVVRFTWRDVVGAPTRVVATLRALLSIPVPAPARTSSLAPPVSPA